MYWSNGGAGPTKPDKRKVKRKKGMKKVMYAAIIGNDVERWVIHHVC